MEEFRGMILKFNNNHPKYGRLLYINMNELKELASFIKEVCEKAQMYDDLCK